MSKSQTHGSKGIVRTTTAPRTAIHDAVLANASARLDAPAVGGVEWAAIEDTMAAIRNPHPLANFDEFVGDEHSKVAL